MPRAWRVPRVYTLLDAVVDGARLDEFGFRAAALAAAQRRGVSMVDTWFLPASVFRDAVEIELPPGHDPAALLRTIHKSRGLERAARARERLLALELPEEVRGALRRFFDDVSGRGWGLSLRASPTLADATLADAVGLEHVTHGITTFVAFQREILRIWSLAMEERTLAELRARRVKDVAIAIAIQRLDPVTASAWVLGNDGAPRFDAVHQLAPSGTALLAGVAWGLGAPATDGASPRDYLRIDGDGNVLARKIAHKPRAAVVLDGSLAEIEVSAADADRPAFDERALFRTADVMRKLDDPWAEAALHLFDGGRVLLSDLRRAIPFDAAPGGAPPTVWSRTGIADLLPGVPTPLTASLVEDFTTATLKKTIESLGARVPRDVALIRRAHGRHYLNVSALIPALSGVPGIDPGVLMSLLRGGDPVAIARALAVEARRGSLPRLSVAVARLYLEEKRLTEALTRYERDAEQRRRWLSEMDLAILPDDALVTTLREIHGVVSITGKLLLESSIAALAAHTSFQALIARFSPEMPARLAQSLSAGNVELESARAATALAHVVEILRSDAAARGVLGSARGAHDLPPGPGRRALESWLEAFGDRGHDELELASPRWEEQLAPVLAMMRAGVRAPAADPEQKLSGVRVDADRELAQLETRASAVERVLVRTLLARTRGLARLRERMRVWMAKVTAMTRRVVLDVDRRMRRLDAGLVPGSAFFLTEHELCSAAGRTRADLGALVRMRRATFDRDAASPDPPDTFAGEPPRLVAPAFDPRIVHGAPASGGIVTGKVRVLGPRGRHAEHVESGEVLVVRTPDIGLAPLFFWVGALVSDSGSALSHAAVVAREVGIPAVLGTLDASTTLRDGELVRVDGDRGVVERLDG